MEKSRVILKGGTSFLVDDDEALKLARVLKKANTAPESVMVSLVDAAVGELSGVAVIAASEIAAVVVSGDKLKPL